MFTLAAFSQKKGQSYDMVDIKLRSVINVGCIDARVEFACLQMSSVDLEAVDRIQASCI